MTGFKNMLHDIADEARPYDVFDRALAAGKRRRQLRQIGAPVGAALMAGVILLGIALRPQGPQQVAPADPTPTPSRSVQAGPPLPTRCVAQRLPVPAGDPIRSAARAIDPTGRYIGGRSYLGNGQHRAILWVDGVPTTVPIVGEDKDIYHVTSSGTLIGSGYVRETLVYTVVEGGRASRLKGVKPEVTDMNDRGVILGNSAGRPAIWRTPTGEPEPLSGPAGLPDGWRPVAIDDDGTILVTTPFTLDPGQHQPVYVWRPDGSVQPLPPAPVGDGSAVVHAQSIRNGWVSGGLDGSATKASTGSPLTGIRWNLRTGEISVSEARGLAINALGWQTSVHAGQGVLFTPDQTVLLPHVDGAAVQPPYPGKPEPSAERPQIFALSDDGRTIVGLQQIAADGETVMVVAVAWRCS